MEIDTIQAGDCAVLMAQLPDACIDLVVTSPPYDDMDMDFNPIPKGGLRKYKGYVWDFKAIAGQLWRVIKPGGVLVWVVGDPTIKGRESLASSLQKIYLVGLGFRVHDSMIYEMAGTGGKGSHRTYRQGHEYMLVFSKGTPKTVNRIKDHKNVTAGKKTGGSPKMNGIGTRYDKARIIPAYSVRSTVWRYHPSNGNSTTTHPAPFPEKLARDHILSWSNPGDLVLDPMCGSGKTCKMAAETGRHYIGFDISETYVSEAIEQVAGARRPLLIID